MTYQTAQRRLPRFLLRRVFHFECSIDDAVLGFANGLRDGARVLDAGAGEGRHALFFRRHRYVGVDLGVGDASWDYSRVTVAADLAALPFRPECFDACINVVALEHVRDPVRVLREIEHALAPGARALVIVPHEWEVHQSPHDYFRFTRHGMAHLLESAGFAEFSIEPVGGYFRLLARRLWNGLQFSPRLLLPLVALFAAPAALLLPSFDSLDRERNFTLGYICIARKCAAASPR